MANETTNINDVPVGGRRGFWKRIGVFLKRHWIADMFLPLLLFYVTYALTTATKGPVYAVSSNQSIAQTVEEGRLKILWDNEEIRNAAVVKIAIWNDGREFINKTDFSTTNPIRMEPNRNVNILSVNMRISSRKDLNFQTTKGTDSKGLQFVRVEMDGDEALERNDGAVFNILFSGPLETDWNVAARVKGVPAGFTRKNWPVPPPRENFFTYTFVVGLIIFASFFAVPMLRAKIKRDTRFDFSEGTTFLALIGGLLGLLFLLKLFVWLKEPATWLLTS